jgi:amino acid adenylation domain-containing protein/thioester reductase-like protein
MDEDVSTKLWLEEYNTRTAAKRKRQPVFKKYQLKNSKAIKTFIKKNKMSWQIFITCAWGYLLSRFSSADVISFGTTSLLRRKQSSLTINSAIKLMNCRINEKTTTHFFIKTIKKQLNSKRSTKDYADLRYLLLFTTKKKKSSFKNMTSAQFPLSLIVSEDNPSHISFCFDATIFSSDSIKNIAEHLQLVIHKLSTTDLKQKIALLNLLTAKEQKNIFQEWKTPVYDFHVPQLKKCMHDLFSQQAHINPQALAIYHNQRHVTYKELDEASTQLAHLLKKNRNISSTPIAVLMDRTPSLIMAMLAIFKCGAIFVPINPKYPKERVEYVLNDCQSPFILVSQKEKIPERYQDKAWVIEEDWSKLTNLTIQPLAQINPEQTAYIIYTSGTTGQPKGVMIKHNSLVNLIAWYKSCFNVKKHDCASQFASQGFDTFLCEVAPCLALGASVHIVDDNIKLTPHLFFEWLVDRKITIADLPTSYAQMLFAMTWPKNINLRLVKIGGESVTHYPDQVFPFDIWNGYGPTETTIEATFIKLCSANTSYNTIVRHFPPPIGRPIAYTEIFVVDKYLQPVPIGIVGELLIGGAGVAVGYLHHPELTAEKFIPHILDKNNSGKLYRTGDLVRWLPDGNLEFIGRIDHQVKIRGYRIELGDIESIISQYPDINEVAVLVRENTAQEKSIVAYVVPNLNTNRYLYQERILLGVKNKFIEAVSEDISKGGIAISGVNEPLSIGEKVVVRLILPGLSSSKELPGRIIWQQNERCGMIFDVNDEDKHLIDKSVEYYLSTHNALELVLSAASKRNLRKALRDKIPEYMIPSAFVTLLQFPLTFSGKIDTKSLPQPEEFQQIIQKEYIAPKTDLEKKLVHIWEKILAKKITSISDNFFDLGGSSLTAAQLSVEILDKFQINIPAKILFDLPYIPILAEYINTKGQSYTQQSDIQQDINKDSQLDENIFPTDKLSPHLLNAKNILLTGAGGFLGVYLLKELLKNTNAKVTCFVRKGEFENPVKKLMANVQKFRLEQDISLADRRLIIIGADISYHHFGLPQERYNHLVNNIDLIIHCGAQVNIMASYNKLRGSNVQGTLEIIKFATTAIDKPIHYISTLSSATRKDAQDMLIEEFPDAEYKDIYGGYAISKWVSERLLSEINNRGLPVTIYRSGYISGQSDTGMTNLNDALLMLIKGCIQMGYAPHLDEKITLLPVDFVSESIVQLSLKFPDGANVFHIDHPTGILWTDLIAWLNDYGYSIKILPLQKWQQLLVTIPQNNALFTFLPHYLSLKEERPAEVSVEKTSHALKSIGLNYPAIDDNLLSIYFDYLVFINFLPIPQTQLHGQQEITS